MEFLLVVLFLALWGSIYWPVYLVMRVVFIGRTDAEAKASLIAIFWPITMPIIFITLLVVGACRRF